MFEGHCERCTQKIKIKDPLICRILTLYRLKFLFIHCCINLGLQKWFKRVIFRSYIRRTKLTSFMHLSHLQHEHGDLQRQVKYLLCNLIIVMQLASVLNWTLWIGDQTCQSVFIKDKPHEVLDLPYGFFN